MDVDIYSVLSKEIKGEKTYSLKEISDFLTNEFNYDKFLSTQNLTDSEKITLYLTYMLKSVFILRYLKKQINKIPNFDEKVVSKKILGIHLQAIIAAKKVNLTDKKAVKQYGFYYGWLDPPNYTSPNLFIAGENVIKKLRKITINDNVIESKDRIAKIAKLSEWRKFIWMRIYLLLPEDKSHINKIMSDFIEKYKTGKIKLR